MLNEYVSRVCGISIIGGEGKRLRPFTDHKPKALLPAGLEKRPMLEFTIKPWLKLGVKKYVFCTGYKNEVIERHFSDGSRFGVKIDYSVEKTKLETGGAIKNAIEDKKLSKNQPIIVFYCDDFVRLNTEDFIKSHLLGVKKYGFKATLVATNSFRCDYGIIETEDVNDKIKRVVEFKEKPLIKKYTNVGIYCLEPEVLEYIDSLQPPFKLEREVIPELVKKGWLMVFEIPWENWLPINTDKDYENILNTNLTDFYSKVL